MNFVGPWQLDLQTPLRTAQEMVGAFARGHLDEPRSAPDRAGAWLIVDGGSLAGFWLSFGDAYLDEGTFSGALPPYTRGFLEALTEEIWWSRLDVAQRDPQVFEPVIVLEWPPGLSARSEFPPPGIRPEDEEEEDTDETGRWLDPTPVRPARSARVRVPTTERFWLALPRLRGHLTVIRGHLERTLRAHRASWEVVHLDDPVDSHPTGEPLTSWLLRARFEDPLIDVVDRLGHPVRVADRRVAFPIAGWLDRELRLSPARWEERVRGELPTRDVSNVLRSQIMAALSVLGAVVVLAFGFAGVLSWLSLPPAPSTVAQAKAAAHPALSVCSESHEGFRRQFRCQLHALLDTGDVAPKDECPMPSDEDVRAMYCGLRDRTADGALIGTETFTRTAAAQACFNVLGQPYTHQLAGDPLRADPARFFDDSENRLRPLGLLSQQLDLGCDVYSGWVRQRVTGTLLAAHAGPGSALEALLAERASVSLAPSEQQCFDAGRRATEDPPIDGLCGAATRPLADELPAELSPDDRAQMAEAVHEMLGNTPAPGSIRSYLEARYADPFASDTPVKAPVFDCYRNLVDGGASERLRGRWDVGLRGPATLGAPAFPTQLGFDAGLLALRDGPVERGPCWSVIEGLVASYTPVHPLRGALGGDEWISEEQQLCGQVCAGRYRLFDTPESWVTPEADVQTCISQEPAAPSEGLDKLGLPWNQAPDGAWVTPEPEQVCAFHLVAQEWIPDVLPDEVPAPYWAGKAGTGIAGGEDGVAAIAARSLARYGGSRTTSYCAAAATQCFAEELLSVLGDGKSQPFEWRRRWETRIAQAARWNRDELTARPWCRLVWPHLADDGSPTGDVDYPCALGVEEARDRFVEAIDTLERDTERGN